MIKRISFSLIIVFVINIGHAQWVQELGGSWQFKSAKDSLWHNCTIPGNSFSALLENELIPDPFLGENEKLVQWVGEQEWWFRSQFSLHESFTHKSQLELCTEGLDTYCEIYLNGNLIANTSNAFIGYCFPISKELLRPTNEVLLKFKSPKLIADQLYETLESKLPGGPRVLMRKPQFHFGWDFGPKLLSSGISRPIQLIAYDTIKLVDASIQTLEISQDSAKLQMKLELQNSSSAAISFSAELFFGDSLLSFEALAQPGDNTLEFIFYKSDPKLWWPNGSGDAFLYKCELTLYRNAGIVASKQWNSGIRTITLVNDKDKIGESFYFKVNGKAIFCKGANYIPSDIISPSSKRLEQLIRDAVSSHFNMIRVWGGGQYEQDDFYALCDKYGLMVWHDFMFACGMYPGDSAYLKNIKREAAYQLRRLSKYSCISLWCGNNEISEAWHNWGWKDDLSKEVQKAFWKDYNLIFKNILPLEVMRWCPQISYWESSPKFGRADSKFKTHGDAHDWGLWHDGLTFDQLTKRTPRFMSEFGFQSIPALTSLKKFVPADELDLGSAALLNHQKHPKGNQIIHQYLQLEYPKPNNFSDLIYLNQLCQAEGISKIIQKQRISKPHCMGSLYWQFNDCWPGLTWSGIDYFGRWKALQHKVKQAFEPISMHLEYDQGKIKIFAVNDKFETHHIDFEFSIQDFYGNPIYFDSQEIEIQANSSLLVMEPVLNIEDLSLNKTHYAYVKWTTDFGSGTSNIFFNKIKELTLPKPSLRFEDIQKTDEGYLFKVYSTNFAKSIYINEESGYSFFPNFFDLNPGEHKVVFCKTNLNWANIKIDINCINHYFNK